MQTLLDAVGLTQWVETEAQIDDITAISGSGPAYVFYLTECLAQAGCQIGLPEDVARRIARATVEGAGALMAQNPSLTPETLRQNVTSPKGTTQAALEVLMETGDTGLAALLKRAVDAAKQRSQDLNQSS